ncbi:gamma-aminobutyric acid type B receptor subunit 2-like isoform X2 [Xenia sp. Carnegie-2017]|uniref:gamma-aminobutyric acid type B receptor subunit 2-like isoform X2 n=1 Tax=Xenia sp. Carnegie-2017 TaxID=2897299 RepID=UPI001F039F41|nr:gamma-aminobutyric acid type B receptor subunit 2-like isoform X2 [Xenia sp. Carnegie-2017]
MPLPITDSSVRVTRMFICLVGWISLVLGNKEKLVIAGIDTERHELLRNNTYHAVKSALKSINDGQELRNYYLEIVWKNSIEYNKDENDHGINAIMEHIKESPPKIAFLSLGCEASYLASVALPPWNVTVIPLNLECLQSVNIVNYPNIVDIDSLETFGIDVKEMLRTTFDWERLFIVKQIQNFDLSADKFNIDLTVEHLRKKKDGRRDYDIGQAIEKLNEWDARIIILKMAESAARKFLCEASKKFHDVDNIVWVILGLYNAKWWDVSDTKCTVNKVKLVLKNVFYVNYAYNRTIDENGSEVRRKFDGTSSSNSSMDKNEFHSKCAVDAGHAIELLAKALKATEKHLQLLNQSLKNYTYARSDIFKLILTKLRNLKNRELNEKDGLVSGVLIKQLLLHENYGEVVNIAWCENKKKCEDFNNVTWAGGNRPSDGKTTKVSLCVKNEVFWSATGASIVGILMALFFFWINNRKSSQDVLKMSTPPLNNLMLLGAVLAYLFIPINGMKKCSKETMSFNTSLCKAEVFLMTIAFSLLFGAIFMKTWRIYRIFTNDKLSKNLRFLTNKYLMLMVALLVVFDLLYLSSWNFIHPLEDKVAESMGRRKHRRAMNLKYSIHECTSSHFEKWFAGLMIYKGLLIVFGIFITWETRNVSFPGLNDSKYIGMCVYNIFITIAVILPLKLLAFKTNVNVSYIVVTSSIMLCTTLTLVLMFFPKLYPAKMQSVTSKATIISFDNGIAVTRKAAREENPVIHVTRH